MDTLIIYIENTVRMAIPLATFGALLVSVILFAKTKGTRDALENTAKNYKDLAESRKDLVEDRDYQIKELKSQNEELTKRIVVQREALCIAIDELVKGFARAGVKLPTPDVDICEEGESDD